MRKMLIGIIILFLLIPSVAPLVFGFNSSDSVNDELELIKVIKSDSYVQYLSIEGKNVKIPFEHVESSKTLDGHRVIENGYHPAFGRTTDGVLMAAYYDKELDSIIWTYSDDDGETFADGIYWEELSGDYPSIKLWEDSRLFGTLVPYDLSHRRQFYLFDCTEPTDFDTYSLSYPVWSGGYYEVFDADIACDSSQNVWEWGVICQVVTTTYGSGVTKGPFFIYADQEIPGDYWISWHYIDNCAHCDIDIDHETIYTYAVWDCDENLTGNWALLCRIMDFDDVQNGYDELFEISIEGNLQYPSVAAQGDNLVILAETDKNGNKDIICIYSDEGINNLKTSFIADSNEDECHPDIRHKEGDNFICTFVKNNNLYVSVTQDGGATWSTPQKINENNNSVVEEYKTSDLCEKAAKVMWEELHDNIDIYIDYLSNPPSAPTVKGPSGGIPDLTYDFAVNSVDPDGDDVRYHVDWGDGEHETTSFQESGNDVMVTHSWSVKGTYTITIKVEDIHGAIGDESYYSFNVDKSKSINRAILQFLQSHSNLFPLLRKALLRIINH